MSRWTFALVASVFHVVVGCRQVLDIEDSEVIELGAICTGDGDGQCQQEAPVCISLTGTTFQCTATCGTTAAPSNADSPIPPADGDDICRNLVSAGTPVCGLFGAAVNGQVPWFCVILCGTFGSEDFGSCPSGLRCTSNSCQ